MAKRSTDASADPDPDKLTRQQAGSYRTADGRFEVREADVGWFLVDLEQTNEFGQELILGPFGTLKAVREAIPGARSAQPTPLRARAKKKQTSRQAKPEPPPPPPSWIDELPSAEARGVRRLIGALEADGFTDAEELVRRDRDGLLPAVALALIERRLATLVDEAPAKERGRARALVRRTAEILTSEGAGASGPLPGWSLVEIGPEPQPANRRIDLRE